jgi:hypothetical protein
MKTQLLQDSSKGNFTAHPAFLTTHPIYLPDGLPFAVSKTNITVERWP